MITLLLVLIALAGCSALTPAPEQPQPAAPVLASTAVKSTGPDSDDAYDMIEQANRELFSEQPFVGPPSPPAQQPIPVIWDRLVGGFSLPDCEPGSTAYTWQEWYGNHGDYMQRVMLRARPWLYDILNQIETRELPYEMALLPIVESAYDTFAFSSAAAVGGWQFTAPTARDYGLKINTWYDGRRDMYAATRAALDYLQVLFKKFDDNWRLALAGYNAGAGRVSRAVARHGGNMRSLRATDLKLPRETKGFAPKLHGLSCLLRNPERYQLKLPAIPDMPLITAVNLEQPVDIVYAAQLTDLPITEVYALNPGLNRWTTPPDGPHRLILPAGKADDFLQAFTSTEQPAASAPEWQTITVKSGDTLGSLARQHNTTLALLREHNRLRSDVIMPGQILRTGTASYNRFPGYAEALAELQKLQQGLLPANRTSHRIRRGESLSTIARQYNVSVTNLQRWNNLRSPDRIRAGQSLVVLAPVKPGGKQRYRVQPGDSLWRIARRNQISVESLRNWNQLPAGTILQPGQVLLLAPRP